MQLALGICAKLVIHPNKHPSVLIAFDGIVENINFKKKKEHKNPTAFPPSSCYEEDDVWMGEAYSLVLIACAVCAVLCVCVRCECVCVTFSNHVF